jgi:segregation and condensation protein B
MALDGMEQQKNDILKDGDSTLNTISDNGGHNQADNIDSAERNEGMVENFDSGNVKADGSNLDGGRAGNDFPAESNHSAGDNVESNDNRGTSESDNVMESFDSMAESNRREEVLDELAHIIEAIIFASDEPINVATIKSVLDAVHTFGRINPDVIVERINALNEKYNRDGSGFCIVEIANGYQFSTRKELAQWVSYLFKEKSKRRLSNSALETLAIIAYKQPVTKPEIESIRGVNVDYVLHNLLEKELVTVVGRAETVGKPLLYGTTQRFLKVFGLKNLEDLPKLREIDEIIKEIKNKGAEESIQLEITALEDKQTSESAAGNPVQFAPGDDTNTNVSSVSNDDTPIGE